VSTSGRELRPDGGRSNGVQPSLSSAFLTCRAVVRPAGVGAPRELHGPAHVRRIFLHQAGPTSAPPAFASTWNDVKVLTNTYLCLAACGDAFSPRRRASHEGFGPCFTLGLIRPRFHRSLLSTGEHYPAEQRMSSRCVPDFLGGSPNFRARIDGRHRRRTGRSRLTTANGVTVTAVAGASPATRPRTGGCTHHGSSPRWGDTGRT